MAYIESNLDTIDWTMIQWYQKLPFDFLDKHISDKRINWNNFISGYNFNNDKISKINAFFKRHLDDAPWDWNIVLKRNGLPTKLIKEIRLRRNS